MRTDAFRSWMSGAISLVVTAVAAVALAGLTDFRITDSWDAVVVTYIISWPVYGGTYVVWSLWAYGRLGSGELERHSRREQRTRGRWFRRLGGGVDTANTTVTAAIVAVAVTLVIAQREQFREEPVYVALALLTVATSWVLMVFSFAQAYLRLALLSSERHIVIPYAERTRLSDFVVLAVFMSTMAATVSASFSSRRAWRLGATNVIIAFTFNSVIIAMMVSLLFGGLGG